MDGAQASPLVSVIIPTYNRRELLAEALASVDSQTFRDFEAIVVDDGSTDGTVEYLAEHHPAVKVLSGARSRRGRARNRGIEEARGKYIAFLDDDDLYEPFHLQQFASAERPSLRAFATRARFWDPESGHTQVVKVPSNARTDQRRACLIGTVFPLPTLVVQKALIDEIGGFPDAEEVDGSEDFVFLTRLAWSTTIEVLPRSSLLIRRHRNRGMYDFDYIIQSRFAARDLLLRDGIAGRRLDKEATKILIAGTHRLAAALHHEKGDEGAARVELAEVHRTLGAIRGLALTYRLWGGTLLGRGVTRRLRWFLMKLRRGRTIERE